MCCVNMSSEPNYRLLARQAIEACSDYVNRLDQAYAARRKMRKRENIPVLAFCGHGRSGKDQSAEFLAANSSIKYGGSVSRYCLPLVAHAMGEDPEVCWETRHDNRDFWREFLDAVRWDDPAMFTRMVLGDADVITGIRAKAELWTSWGEQHIDQIIWVDRPNTPIDPTLQYSRKDLECLPMGSRQTRGLLVLLNTRDLDNLEKRVCEIAQRLGVTLNSEGK